MTQPLPRKYVGAAALILDLAGHVLLVKHSYGRLNWELPGGGSEAGESPTDTAVREVYEETGLNVAVERLTGVYHDPTHPLGEFIHFVFACRCDRAQTPTPMPPEITSCGFWPSDELPRPISDFTILRIRDALTPPGSLLPQTVRPRRYLEYR